MGSDIIVSPHAAAETTKPSEVGLRYAGLEARICFRVLNVMKSQMIQRKRTMQVIKVGLNIFCEWF